MLISAACGSAEAASPSAVGQRIAVVLSDYAFSPAVIEAPADEQFTLDVRNAGRIEHDLTVEALRFKVVVRSGRSATRVLGPLPRGTTYVVVCTISGHREAGMVGKLVAR
jgi:uncharacterized cupredoxin-like copper-binding protein